MARAPEYRQQTRTPNPQGLERLSNIRGGGSPVGAGLAEFGKGAVQLAGNIQETRERNRREAYERDVQNEHQFALTDSIKSDEQWSAYADESLQTAPSNGAGMVEKFDKDFAEYLPQAMSGYKTEEGRQRAEVVYAQVRRATRDRLLGESARLLANDSDMRRRDALGTAEKLVNVDPSKFGVMEAKVTALASELPGLTEAQRSKFIGEQRRSLSAAAGYGAVAKSPYSVLKDLSQERPSAPWAAHLEVEDVMRLRSAAQSEVNRRESEARAAQIEMQATLRADLADAFAARSYGAPAKLPDRSRFVAAFGKEGAQRYSDASGRWAIYDVAGEAAFLPPVEAAAALARLKPTGQEGAAASAENYEAATRLYAEQRRQLEADPVAVLSQRDPAVASAREAAIADNKNIPAYFSTLRARQEALGIAEPKLLPESQRTSIAAGLQFDPNAPLKRVQAIASLRQSYGDAFPAIMQEVAPKLDGHARVLVQMAPRDAERLDGAFAQKDTYTKTLPAKATNEIKTALQNELHDFGASLADNPDAEDRIAEHQEAALIYAQSLVLRGSSTTDAARVAATAVVNGQYKYRGMLRIPSVFDEGLIESSLNSAKAELASKGEFLVAPAKGADPAQANAEMRNVIERNGYWITNENGTGAVLRIPHRSGMGEVYRPDGSRVEISFDALNAPFALNRTRSLNDPMFSKVK